MIRLLPAFLGAAALYALGGWCVEAHRNRALRREVEAYRAEDWLTAEEAAELAGRSAWHAGSVGMTVPPGIPDHLRAAYVVGWRREEARERAECELWNAGARS